MLLLRLLQGSGYHTHVLLLDAATQALEIEVSRPPAQLASLQAFASQHNADGHGAHLTHSATAASVAGQASFQLEGISFRADSAAGPPTAAGTATQQGTASHHAPGFQYVAQMQSSHVSKLAGAGHGQGWPMYLAGQQRSLERQAAAVVTAGGIAALQQASARGSAAVRVR